MLFALIICTGINSGLAQSGTEPLPDNVRQRSDGAIDFIPPIKETVTVNEEAPRDTATPQSTANTGTAQICEKLKHCEDWQIQDASVCIVEKQEEQNKEMECSPYFRGSGMNTRNAGVVNLILKVASLNEMLEKLNAEVSNACFRIKRLIFIGGGNSGYMNIGLNQQTVSQLKPYSCLMTRRSDVLIDGNPIGKGCSGRFFMQEIAENLLPPDDRRASVLFRTTNRNRYRYVRLRNHDEQWRYHSFSGGSMWDHRNVLGGYARRSKSLPDFCRDDMNDKITRIKSQTRDLMNNDGKECSRLIQCRGSRLPYADVLNNAERVAGNIRENDRNSLLDANRAYIQMLHIQNVLSQCTSETEHIGCTYQQFLGRGGSGRSSVSGSDSNEESGGVQ